MLSRVLRECIVLLIEEDEQVQNSPPVWAKYFHLSSKYLGDEFEFTPRIPGAPFEDDNADVIEDTVTPRVSFASSIKDAWDAIPNHYRVMFVYAVPKLPGKVDLEGEFEKRSDKLDSPDNDYGEMWTMKKYLDWKDEDIASDSPEMKKRLKKLVPDAEKTDEMWATKPVNGKLVGVIDNRGSDRLKNHTPESVFWRGSRNFELLTAPNVVKHWSYR